MGPDSPIGPHRVQQTWKTPVELDPAQGVTHGVGRTDLRIDLEMKQAARAVFRNNV